MSILEALNAHRKEVKDQIEGVITSALKEGRFQTYISFKDDSGDSEKVYMEELDNINNQLKGSGYSLEYKLNGGSSTSYISIVIKYDKSKKNTQ